ncbi:cell adhesion molecule CEACAM1-like [Ctenodactylus gundi]
MKPPSAPPPRRGVRTSCQGLLLTVFVVDTHIVAPGPAYSGRETIFPNGSLLIRRVTQKDAGHYALQTLTRDLRATEVSGQFRVFQPVAQPSIQTTSSSVTEEDSLVLTCLSRDKGVATRWIFNGQNLQLTERTKLSQDHSTLTIDPVRREDAVEYQSKLPKPFIDINGTEYVEGDDPVILTCEPETPNTTYQWKVNGQSLSGSDNDKLKLSNSNRTLTVFRVPSGETVTFQCKTQNPVSDGLSDPVTLSVLYGPDAPVISSPDSYLTPGADLHLTCNTTSNPDAQISWIVNGKTLQSTPELFIPKITTSSSGVYICLVHNPLTGLSKTAVKKITVSATEPVARPSIQASSTTVNEQDSLVLTCLSHDTGIAIRWIFNGQNLQLTETTKLSQDRSILTIDPVTKEDAGEYQCEVLTPVSSRESDPIVLAKRHPTSIYRNSPEFLHCRILQEGSGSSFTLQGGERKSQFLTDNRQ